MRIDNSGLSGVSSERTDKTGQMTPDNQDAGKAASKGASDEVQLSSLSEQVRVLAQTSPERSQRLERLAAAVAAGQYNVDPLEVSRGIVQDALAQETPESGKR